MVYFNYFDFLIILLFSDLASPAQESESEFDKNGQELLLCRKCGADVADSYYIFNKSSPGAKKIEKQNLFGLKNVTTQLLVNPFGVQFQVLTLKKARCENVGLPHGGDSWFPGYSWRICTCPHCGQHLGWTFEQSSSTNENNVEPHTFHGLIMSNILGENYSLIMMPKMYKM